MSHDLGFDGKFLAGLAAIDAAYARKVQLAGCRHCEAGTLDRADYSRKPRGELGEAAGAYARRLSLCCRSDGCRRRSTPPSLRFLGRKVYFAALVVVASATGRARHVGAVGGGPSIHGVPRRTVRRWLEWWQTAFARSAFFVEAKGFFSSPPEPAELPASLLARFGDASAAQIEKMLRFIAPVTTTSVRTRVAMAV